MGTRRNRIATLCVVAVFALAAAGVVRERAKGVGVRAAGLGEASSLPSQAAKMLDERIEAMRQKEGITGMSVAVALGGKVIYSGGFGLADVENNVAATAATVYRTASVAKPMTATAVMQLAAKGKLDLDAPIQTYCNEFPVKQWPVTARQLLAHLGGIRHYARQGESNGTKFYFTVGESLAEFKEDALQYEPGTRYNYTTYGYSVLGCAIEGASGQAYEVYMQENVWGPAGMTQTLRDNHFLLIPGRAKGYQKIDNNVYGRMPEFLKAKTQVGAAVNAPLADTSMKIAGGGLVSTAVDLVRFAAAFQAGALVDEKVRDEMWSPKKLAAGAEISTGQSKMGYGWFLQDSNGLKVAMHTGGQAGTTCILYVMPEKGLAIAVMTNLQNATGIGQIVGGVRTVVLEEMGGAK